ncbi:MAG: GNAT family N-acetyltransferase [Anaerolineales bacterium]|nr:GNAT family N-acetyltransferase [Anaerolineales bacterium]
MPANPAIRSMNLEDLDFAAQGTAAEGWVSEGYAGFLGFFAHYSPGCLLAEISGKPVGICMATPYGDSGFIGELIVKPEARGQGIGAALIDWAVSTLRQTGAHTIYLDGVVKAVDLYERHGFRRVCRSLRLRGEVQGRISPETRPMQVQHLEQVFALDRNAFGADRSFFIRQRLEYFPELSKILMQEDRVMGYILGRRGTGWASAGPWVVSREAAHPVQLLYAFASEVNTPFSVGILESHRQAVELVRSLGFVERADCPWRMALGPQENLGKSLACYAVGSAAKG